MTLSAKLVSDDYPTAIDLFSGCGGLTTGLKQAGFNVLGAVEVDPLSVETYQANHSGVEVWNSDIKALECSRLLSKLQLERGHLGLLAGCPPCQGFSSLRTNNGARAITDSRNDLILEMLRFVDALLPKAVMLENVPAIAHDKRFRLFCNKMKRMGYVGSYYVLNAADYGVPQRRRRLIYLAGLDMEIPFATKATKSVTVKEVIGRLSRPGRSGDPLHDIPQKHSPHVMDLIRHIPKDGGSRRQLPEEYKLDCHRRCDGFKDVYGRMAWNDVAPTITTGCFNPSKGRFIHPQQDRAITMREAALLQGFPEEYKFPENVGKSAIALMIGNALPPPFVAAHASMIRTKVQQMDVSPKGVQ